MRGKIDHRYFAVRSLRNANSEGRELNCEAGKGDDDISAGFILDNDERWLRNFNIHSLERKTNVSCSYNPRSGLCYTCCGEVHSAWEGKNGEPVVYVASDQSFPANVPATGSGECLRVMRVEDGRLHEVVSELLLILKRRQVVPGSVVMLGSLTQLGRDGTAYYAMDWQKCRQQIMRALGDVIVVPAFHLPTAAVSGRHIVRSLLEFTMWYLDLPDHEVGLLKEARKDHLEFLCGKTGGEGWGDCLQNLRLPLGLEAEGTSRFKSRDWGERPDKLGPVSEDMERMWLDRICGGFNLAMHLSLASAVASSRSLLAVRGLEAEGERLAMTVVGASNAARTAAALERQGIKATKVGQKGWRLSNDADSTAAALAERADATGESGTIVLHCLDNEAFFSLDKNGSTLPRKVNKKYHVPGKVAVAKGDQPALLLDYMMPLLKGHRTGPAVIITPVPRFLAPCCTVHAEGKSEDQLMAEAEKTVSAVWSMKRELMQMLTKAHVRNMILISPLEVLGVKDSLEEVMGIFEDGVHLKDEHQDELARHVIKKVEEFLVTRKRGPTERAGPADKRSRNSLGGDGPGWGGRGRGGRGGRGGSWRDGFANRGGGRHYSAY